MIQLAEEINVVSATDGDASLENESTIGKQEKKEKGKRKKEKGKRKKKPQPPSGERFFKSRKPSPPPGLTRGPLLPSCL